MEASVRLRVCVAEMGQQVPESMRNDFLLQCRHGVCNVLLVLLSVPAGVRGAVLVLLGCALSGCNHLVDGRGVADLRLEMSVFDSTAVADHVNSPCDEALTFHVAGCLLARLTRLDADGVARAEHAHEEAYEAELVEVAAANGLEE